MEVLSTHQEEDASNKVEDIADKEENASQEDWEKKYKELKMENKRITQDNEKMKQVAEDVKAKNEKLVTELEERVRCPVCLDIPTTSPIHSCPAGHCLCSSCYQGKASTCPVCRAVMGANTSLLAMSIIQSIDHLCRFEGCDVKVPLKEFEMHKATCKFRVVICPSVMCKKGVAYCHVVDHVLSECESSFVKRNKGYKNVTGSNHETNYTIDNASLLTNQFSVDGFCFKDHYFFLTNNKVEGFYRNMYVQMLGTKEECDRFSVGITIRNENRDGSISYTSKPFPLEIDDEDKKDGGLTISNKVLKKLTFPEEGKEERSKYSVKFDFKEV